MKIALVGSAPASARLAPYGNPDWKIWGCSPGLYGVAPRIDEWFELHLWEPGAPWFSPEYCQWLAALPGRGVALWTGSSIEALPGSRMLPRDELLAHVDDRECWFCSSSLYWMMARAIAVIDAARAQRATDAPPEHDIIGFWGVDMAAGEEYEMQRAGIHYLSKLAKARDIEVGAPPESDLFTPRFCYGFDEWTHSFRKVRARRAEMEQRQRDLEAQARQAAEGVAFFKGALENLKYMHETWADKGLHTGPLS